MEGTQDYDLAFDDLRNLEDVVNKPRHKIKDN